MPPKTEPEPECTECTLEDADPGYFYDKGWRVKTGKFANHDDIREYEGQLETAVGDAESEVAAAIERLEAAQARLAKFRAEKAKAAAATGGPSPKPKAAKATAPRAKAKAT